MPFKLPSFLTGLTRKKLLNDDSGEETKLKKGSLSVLDLTVIGIGSTLGTIFYKVF